MLGHMLQKIRKGIGVGSHTAGVQTAQKRNSITSGFCLRP
jgi:hypothetical protein